MEEKKQIVYSFESCNCIYCGLKYFISREAGMLVGEDAEDSDHLLIEPIHDPEYHKISGEWKIMYSSRGGGIQKKVKNPDYPPTYLIERAANGKEYGQWVLFLHRVQYIQTDGYYVENDKEKLETPNDPSCFEYVILGGGDRGYAEVGYGILPTWDTRFHIKTICPSCLRNI